MDKVKNYESKAKARCRRIMTEWRGIVHNISLEFPSIFAKSTKEAFKTGIETRETYIVPIECIPERRPLVAEQLSKLTDNYCEIVGVKAHAVKLENYLDKGDKIDYMPYDICGNFTAQLARWFYLYQEYFADGMRFPITLQVGNKRSQVSVFEAVEYATDDKYFAFVERFLSNTEFYFADGMLSKTAMESLYSQIYLLNCSMPSKELEFKSVNIYSNADEVEREEGQIGKLAETMVLLDIEVKDRHLRQNGIGSLRSILSVYNEMAKRENIVLEHRVRKSKAKKENKPMKLYNPPRFKNAHEIARQLEIYGNYKSINDVPQGKQSWITIHAKQNGLCPVICLKKITDRLQR